MGAIDRGNAFIVRRVSSDYQRRKEGMKAK
jgi:hypothetical protein